MIYGTLVVLIACIWEKLPVHDANDVGLGQSNQLTT